jgi:hypothetical protein
MRYCVAAKRGRDDQTEAKYSMRQGNLTIPAWLARLPAQQPTHNAAGG